MVRGDKILVNVLAERLISNINEEFRQQFDITAHHKSLALYSQSSETNFATAFLTGSQFACDAFAEVVYAVADRKSVV